MSRAGYREISDYGVIGNARTCALVSRDASIDWACLPQLYSDSVFAALLDRRRGGYFQVGLGDGQTGEQRYLEDTNVLCTTFQGPKGRLQVTDFMPLGRSLHHGAQGGGAPEIYRVLECPGGEVEVEVLWAPRLDYARLQTRIHSAGSGFVAEGNGARISIAGLPGGARVEADEAGQIVIGRFRLRQGQRVALVTRFDSTDTGLDPDAVTAELDRATRLWREWVAGGSRAHGCREWAGEHAELVVRSELAMKLLVNAGTGAIAAAATTSLPETIGGVRNWDYRFAWVRDCSMTAQALLSLGHRHDAHRFVRWLREASGEARRTRNRLPLMYGLDGSEQLKEQTLGHLEGYRCSSPVRIGNEAAEQQQHDVYGEVLDSVYELVRAGIHPSEETQTFLRWCADRAAAVWHEPDDGIWEFRGPRRHFVYSKVMAWVALRRACQLSRWGLLQGDAARWATERDRIEDSVLKHGFDPKQNAFVQAYGDDALDATSVMFAVHELLPMDDPRVQGTLDRTLEKLTSDGMVYRYLNDDGLPGKEGTFGLCTFWTVDALALSGRLDEARQMFDNMARRANHLGLYAEQIDPATGGFLGNFPQLFTHVGLINSTLYLAQAEGKKLPVPALIGTAEHRRQVGESCPALRSTEEDLEEETR